MDKYNFYNMINKPDFSPPPIVFAVMWNIIYFLMLISLCFIFFMPKTKFTNLAYLIFFSQLILNLAWVPIFFIFKQIKIAFFLSILLTILVAFMIFIFFKISNIAALLQIPYILWLLFADFLMLNIVIMNPQQDKSLY